MESLAGLYTPTLAYNIRLECNIRGEQRGRHDTQHNDNEYNDTQHNDTAQ